MKKGIFTDSDMNTELTTSIIASLALILVVGIPLCILEYKDYRYGSHNIEIKNMIITYWIITNTSKDYDQVYEMLKKSEIFRQIASGNRVFIFNGYKENLIAIKEELLAKEEIEETFRNELCRINRDAIRIVDTSRRIKRMRRIV